MAIKHLPNGYKPLVNQCGVKFDVQRVCTEEDTGPQVLTLYWPSNVEQYALYAASCPIAANSPVSSCGQYAYVPHTSQVDAVFSGEATLTVGDPAHAIIINRYTSPTFDAYGSYNGDSNSYLRLQNNLSTAIRILGVRLSASSSVGTAPGGDASQGQNAISRAAGVGILPMWEIRGGVDAACDLPDPSFNFVLRDNSAAPFVWPKNAGTTILPDGTLIYYLVGRRQFFGANPYTGTRLTAIASSGWWESGGTLQLPFDTENLEFNYTSPGSEPDNTDVLGYVLNVGEFFRLNLYQHANLPFGDSGGVYIIAPMTIEITYEQAEAHP